MKFLRKPYLRHCFLTSIFFIFTTFLWGQRHTEITKTLEERLADAEIVFEGIVLESTSFWNETRSRIYTRHTIQIEKLFKGETDATIELITQGGEIDEIFQTQSHAMSLAPNFKGVFFCKHFTTPQNERFLMVNGSTGFVKYSKKGNKLITNYQGLRKIDVVKTLYKLSHQNLLRDNPEDLTGVEYEIKNITLNGSTVDFDIYVEGLLGNYDLTRSELIMEYDPTVLGMNIASNGVLNVTKGTVSNSSNYNLVVGDINPNRVSIKIEAINTGLGLYTITNLDEQLIHIQMTSPLAGNPDMHFDELSMQPLSKFLNVSNTIETFQEVFTVGRIEDIGNSSVVITGFTPNPITAGTGNILSITGINFGPAKGIVRFPNADNGGQTFMTTLPNDIIFWSDTLIEVKVPSQSGTGVSPAGSGIFEVETSTGQIFNSVNPLEISYALLNFGASTSTETFLADDIRGDGAIDNVINFSIDNTINNNANARAAVEQALCDWNEETGIRWELEGVVTDTTASNNDSINLIYLAHSSEFIGGSVDATAFTLINGNRINTCQNPLGTVNPVPYLREVDIVIREDLTTLTQPIQGGYNFDRAINPNANQIDFYSVILHELGHAHLLKHAIGNNKIMFWQLVGGATRRNISVDDANGGSYILDTSIILLNQAFCPDFVVPIGDQVVNCTVSTFETISNKVNVLIYPNPFEKKVNINIQLENQVDLIEWKLFNTLGQEIKRGKWHPIVGENNFVLRGISNLPDGLYYLNLFVDNFSYTHKILKR